VVWLLIERSFLPPLSSEWDEATVHEEIRARIVHFERCDDMDPGTSLYVSIS